MCMGGVAELPTLSQQMILGEWRIGHVEFQGPIQPRCHSAAYSPLSLLRKHEVEPSVHVYIGRNSFRPTTIEGVWVPGSSERGEQGVTPPQAQTRCQCMGGAAHSPLPTKSAVVGGCRCHPTIIGRGSVGALDTAPSAGGMPPAWRRACAPPGPHLTTPWNPGR